MREWRVAAMGAAGATGLVLAACHGAAGNADPAPMMIDKGGYLVVPARSPLRTHLRVAEVGAASAAGAVDLPATVEADPARVVNILTPVAGRVTALNVRLGERVYRGETLAVLSSGDLAQASSDVVRARDAYALAAKALSRARGVQQAGGAAQKDLEAAESSDAQAKAELDRANARMVSLNGAARVRGGSLVLTAPENGVVTSLAIANGAQVSDPTATLMTVANLDRVYVTANAAEGDLGLIEPGADAAIALTAYPGRVIHGRLSEVNVMLEPDTRRQKVRVALDNPGWRLMPNMFATVSLARANAPGGVYAPQSALLMNNDEISVFVEVRPWVFQRRVVKIGDETDTEAHVISGLNPGDRVVVSGGVLLND